MGNTKGLGLLPMSSEWLRTNGVTVGNQLCQMLLFILGQLKMGSHLNRDALHYTTGSSVVASRTKTVFLPSLSFVFCTVVI